MKIESIRLKNFRMFREVTISKLPNCSVFVGANGTGKSSLFDLFGFLRDALSHNVQYAFRERGGFSEVVSRDSTGPIELELKLRDLESTSSLVTYCLVIDQFKKKPVVKREFLKYRLKQRGGRHRHFLDFSLGRGKVITNDKDQEQNLVSPDILALKVLGQLQAFDVACELRQFLENGHFFDFQLHKAIKINPTTGYDEHLSRNSDNLALFARTLYDNYPEKYQEIQREMARRISGFAKVEPVTEKGGIFLEFYQGLFKEPFQSWQVSDGTLQMFAHLLLLHDPNPHQLLCVEEPEKQFYPDLLRILAEEFNWYAKNGGGQVFVSTHSPEFLNGAKLNGIFWLTQKEGYTQVHTTAEDQLKKKLIEVGDLPGALWTGGFFEGAHPLPL